MNWHTSNDVCHANSAAVIVSAVFSGDAVAAILRKLDSPVTVLPHLLLATLEQMAGQMIVVGFQGNDVDDASVAALREDLAASELGGVMFLKTNVKDLATVTAMNQAFRAASPELLPQPCRRARSPALSS